MESILKLLKKKDKCCCCVNLRRGTLIILWFWIILTFVVVALLIFGICVLSDIDIGFESAARNWNCISTKIKLLNILVALLMYQLLPLSSAMYGVYKRKPSYLEPYIFLKLVEFLFWMNDIIMMTLDFFLLIANQSRLGYVGDDEAVIDVTVVSAFGIVAYIGIVAYTILTYYCTCVVYSYYLKVKEEVKQQSLSPGYAASLAPEMIMMNAGNKPFVNVNLSPMENQPLMKTPSVPVESHQPFVANNLYPYFYPTKQ